MPHATWNLNSPKIGCMAFHCIKNKLGRTWKSVTEVDQNMQPDGNEI
jgi:hypothetical protein